MYNKGRPGFPITPNLVTYLSLSVVFFIVFRLVYFVLNSRPQLVKVILLTELYSLISTIRDVVYLLPVFVYSTVYSEEIKAKTRD